MRIISLLTALTLFAAPLRAQQLTTHQAKPATPTFDTLLAADTYEVYGEVRNVGLLLTTGGAGEIIEPITKLADPPKEFKSIIKFLKSNSEALTNSRLLFATWPVRADVPTTFVAIEFSSAEEGEKFAPRLENFLPSVFPPVPLKPDAKPSNPTHTKPIEPGRRTITETGKETATGFNPASPPKAERLPFVIRHSGRLVFISDKPFKFEKLNPTGSKPLAEDQNFGIARDRFSAESIFIFFNVALEERSRPQPSPQPIAEAIEEPERIKNEQQPKGNEVQIREMTPNPSPAPSPIQAPIEGRPVVLATGNGAVVQDQPPPPPAPTQAQQPQRTAYSQMGTMLEFLGTGKPQWPEAVGLSLALDNSEYVIRVILIESQSAKRLPLPFLPQLISGPASVVDAPSVLPDDTEIFVSASIDLPQTYEGMRKQAEAGATDVQRQFAATEKDEPLDPFGAFEKRAGIKIKEDVMPVLGNEIAIAGSLKSLQGVGGFGLQIPSAKAPSAKASEEAKQKVSEAFPMLLIAIKDREAARGLMPRVFDGLGIGEANLIAQTEKRDETEIVNYGGVFAYAFVGNFLVVSNTATVRRVIDANINHQTLASNSAFRNSSRWQPRQILGEFYMSPALMEGYQDEIRKQSATMDTKMRDFLWQVSPTSSAITYALSNDGFGALHELHLPKNLIIAMIAQTAAAMSMKEGSPEMNEAIAIGFLHMIVSAEATYEATEGHGSYGSLDKLTESKLVQKEMFEKYGYRIDLSVSGDQFGAVAIPLDYGKTGRRSFFVDQSGVVRGDDHGGGPATISDKPLQ